MVLVASYRLDHFASARRNEVVLEGIVAVASVLNAWICEAIANGKTFQIDLLVCARLAVFQKDAIAHSRYIVASV